MTALTDPRPHVFMETQIDPGAESREDGPYALVVGRLVGSLLDTWPDIDLPTIRLWRHSADGVPTVRVDARRGELAGVECPQCHQAAGRPHTEYCTLQLREEVFAASSPSLIDQVIQDQHQQALGQTSQPPTLTSGPATFSREHWADLAEIPYPPTHPKGQHGLDQARPGQCASCRHDYDVDPGPGCQTRDVHDNPGPRLVCRRCIGYGLFGVAAGVNPVPCPDCSA